MAAWAVIPIIPIVTFTLTCLMSGTLVSPLVTDSQRFCLNYHLPDPKDISFQVREESNDWLCPVLDSDLEYRFPVGWLIGWLTDRPTRLPDCAWLCLIVLDCARLCVEYAHFLGFVPHRSIEVGAADTVFCLLLSPDTHSKCCCASLLARICEISFISCLGVWLTPPLCFL